MILFVVSQLYEVKSPQATIFPSLCVITLQTVSLSPHKTLNKTSLTPSLLRRTILFAASQLYAVKAPPTRISPLFLIARALTTLLNHHQISKETSCVPLAFRRVMKFTNVQLYDVKAPPTSIFPLLWIARVLRSKSNQFPIVNQVSRVPPVFRRTILFVVVQSYFVKSPPTRIFPPLWIVRTLTIASNHFSIIKELSGVPSVFKRMMLLHLFQSYFVKSPPTRIFPPLWIVIVLTGPSNQTPIVNQVSMVPLIFRRTILFFVVQLYDVKSPPTSIFPSFWIANVLMVPLNQFPIVKEESIDPLVLRRMILFAVTQLYDVKSPQAIIFPPLWIANVLIASLNHHQIVKEESLFPSA